MSELKVLMAIPARGGSKRLKRKNLADINGKPMIAYTIEAAIGAGLGDMIYVCTEDAEIKSVSLDYGAKVFDISEDMAGDMVSSTVPCVELYKSLTAKGEIIDYLFNLQPTSPLRTSSDIAESFKTIINNNADFLASTTLIDPHYFHWALREVGGDWTMFFGKEFLKERPLLPNIYRPNGAIKLGKAKLLAKTGTVFEKNLCTYEMPEDRSIHVATEFDLLCVRTLLNMKD